MVQFSGSTSDRSSLIMKVTIISCYDAVIGNPGRILLTEVVRY